MMFTRFDEALRTRYGYTNMEGTAANVDRYQNAGTTALYRATNPGGDEILTTDEAERGALLGTSSNPGAPTVAPGTPGINGLSFGTGTIDGKTYGVIQGPAMGC